MHLALFSKSRFDRDAGTGRYRGSSSSATPGIAISVDASRHFWASFDSDRSLNAIGGALCTLLEEHGLPATWGLPEPLTSGLVSQLGAGQRAILSHEIALRLDGYATGPYRSRTVLADLLSRHMGQAKTSGLSITTLFADKSLVSGNHDLLVRRGITALRNFSAPGAPRDKSPRLPHQLRYGLWGFPIAHTLPADGLVSGIEKLLLEEAADPSAVRRTRVFHVSVELARLSSGDRAAWRVLEKSLRRMARLRTECGVRVESLRALTARLSVVPVAAPQRSILHRAA